MPQLVWGMNYSSPLVVTAIVMCLTKVWTWQQISYTFLSDLYLVDAFLYVSFLECELLGKSEGLLAPLVIWRGSSYIVSSGAHASLVVNSSRTSRETLCSSPPCSSPPCLDWFHRCGTSMDRPKNNSSNHWRPSSFAGRLGPA